MSTCASCRFYDARRENCRAHPPVPFLDPASDNGYSQLLPEVGEGDWCGEHQEKPWNIGEPVPTSDDLARLGRQNFELGKALAEIMRRTDGGDDFADLHRIAYEALQKVSLTDARD